MMNTKLKAVILLSIGGAIVKKMVHFLWIMGYCLKVNSWCINCSHNLYPLGETIGNHRTKLC